MLLYLRLIQESCDRQGGTISDRFIPTTAKVVIEDPGCIRPKTGPKIRGDKYFLT